MKSRFIMRPTERKPRGHVDITKAIKGLKKIGLMPVIVSARGHRRSVRSDDDQGRSQLRTTNDIGAFERQTQSHSQLSGPLFKCMGS